MEIKKLEKAFLIYNKIKDIERAKCSVGNSKDGRQNGVKQSV